MKRFLCICAAAAVLGLALMAVGFFTGADTSARFTGNGFAVADGEETPVSEQTDAFTKLTVRASSGDVRVVTGESYGYTIEPASKGAYTVSLKNGELTIENASLFEWPLFPFQPLIARQTGCVITVTVPEGARLESVSASVVSGTMRVEGISTDKFAASVTSGDARLISVKTDSLAASCVSGTIDMENVDGGKASLSATSGSIKGEGMTASSLAAGTTSGSISLAGVVRGDVDIDVTSGEATLKLDAPLRDYRRVHNATSGTITVNGNPGWGSDLNEAAPYTIKANVTSGDIHLVFTQE